MHVEVLTIFPNLFTEFLTTSLVGKAIGEGEMSVEVHISEISPRIVTKQSTTSRLVAGVGW